MMQIRSITKPPQPEISTSYLHNLPRGKCVIKLHTLVLLKNCRPATSINISILCPILNNTTNGYSGNCVLDIMFQSAKLRHHLVYPFEFRVVYFYQYKGSRFKVLPKRLWVTPSSSKTSGKSIWTQQFQRQSNPGSLYCELVMLPTVLPGQFNDRNVI